jgi:hypothetical protein
MAENQVPPGTPEAWEIDDRVHEYLDREYLQIPESPYRREYDGCVPSAGERSLEHLPSGPELGTC